MGLVYYGLPTFPETNIAIAATPLKIFVLPQKERVTSPSILLGAFLLLVF